MLLVFLGADALRQEARREKSKKRLWRFHVENAAARVIGRIKMTRSIRE